MSTSAESFSEEIEMNGDAEIRDESSSPRESNAGTAQSTSGSLSDNELMRLEWMVRPCGAYKTEYKQCKQIGARFHQYFVDGKTLDCNQWYHDLQNCQKWIGEKDATALRNLVESEKQRRKDRLKAHYRNDVWEKREVPPEDWSAPLPEWLSGKIRKSTLASRKEELNEYLAAQDNRFREQSCSIM